MLLEKLQVIVNEERKRVLPRNLRNFDVETADYVSAIKAQPEDYDKLTSALWRRIQRFQRDDLSMLPPLLLRFEGENAREWIERCYNAWR